jgi:hypothetical protein
MQSATFRRLTWSVPIGLALMSGGCGDGNASDTTETFMAISGAEVIEATREAGTARVTIEEHASVADPGTDHGSSGFVEEDLRFEGEYDFRRNRSAIRWEFPAFALGFVQDDPEQNEGARRVEARVIDTTAYVRDGSWLCPSCGMHDGEPLPSDKWITAEVPGGGKAFDFSFNVFYGQLGWLELIDEPVQSVRTDTIDDVPVGVYEARVRSEDVEAAARESDEAGVLEAPDIQGDDVHIRFEVDGQRRLRRLAVTYEKDDRTRTITALLNDFGVPVEIERPPAAEILAE